MFSACTEKSQIKKYEIGNNIHVYLDEPVVVSMSEVGEKRWGEHQFAKISTYPGDRILLRYHLGEDIISSNVWASPAYISSDKGDSWKPFTDDGLPHTGMSYSTLSGEFICLPQAEPFNLKSGNFYLPEKVGEFYLYEWHPFYRLDECPREVQNFFSHMEVARWSPVFKKWQKDTIKYDTRDALAWTRSNNEEKHLIPRTRFEHPPLHIGDELLFADYWTNFLKADGSVPKQIGVTCMVSLDNGHSWTRRSTIALDFKGKDAITEPMIAENVKGELVCVMRRADQEQKSMIITFSKDKGKTWEQPVGLDQLGKFGVMPCLVKLECGVMVLSYGRPGLWLSFSLNGTGREWTDPICLLESEIANRTSITDGYTTMLPIGPNQLLLSYTRFDHKDELGKQRKAVMVRMLTIEGL